MEGDDCSEVAAGSEEIMLEKLTRRSRKRYKSITTSAGSQAYPAKPRETHRCIIFAQHRRSLDLVEDLVMKPCFPSVPYLRLDGKIDAPTRGRIVAEFNDSVYAESDFATHNLQSIERIVRGKSQNGHARILLVTTRSCGVGLNLTAADVVIFLQHDWNPFVDVQVRACSVGPLSL